MTFAALHTHTQLSPMDSIASSADYLKRAGELGYKAVACTDHGELANHRDHLKVFRNTDIKPILGIETYFSVTDRFDKRSKAKRSDGTSTYNHLIIHAMNEKGLQNLNRINEEAWNSGFYSKPRMDRELLEKYGDDLIVLSACMSGPIAQALKNGEEDRAYERATWFKDLLGNRFYIEVMTENGQELNNQLLMLADTLGIAPVITEDTHYVWPDQLWVEDAFLISSTKPSPIKGRLITDSAIKNASLPEKYNYLYGSTDEVDRMTFQDFDLYMAGRASRKEMMRAQGIDRDDIFDNTVKIADRIEEYPFHTNLNLLPKPKSSDPVKRLREMVIAGAKRRGTYGKEEYDARRNHELDIIIQKDNANYFVMGGNMAQWAEKAGIFAGFGRGSAGGSLVCYELFMTHIDPIEYDLIFERFLDPDREDPPDWDWDISDKRRGDVKDYLTRQYKHVSSIATFNYYKVKNSLKDAASILNIPFKEANGAIEVLPDIGATWDDYLNQSEAFHKKYPDVLKLAQAFEGRVKNQGMHAAGVVILNQPASNIFPIKSAEDKNTKQRIPLIAYDMDIVAEMGGIKYDLLGLKTLTVCQEAIEAIEARTGKKIDFHNIPDDDADVLAMLNDGMTKGIFQAEGGAFTKWIKDTGVRNFMDLVIGTSIARPGPMNTVGPIYKRRLAGEEAVTYVHPLMENALQETLGTIVYQEQVMKTLQDLGGMSVAKTNRVRKVLSKKKDKQALAQYRDDFIEGASRHISRGEAEQLWHDIEAHTGYSFNKSHAVAYSKLTNATAWLKYHYPLEYMYALIKNQTGTEGKKKIPEYIIEAERLGVKVVPPHINTAALEMSIIGDDIQMGLIDVKGVGPTSAPKLLDLRPFKSYKEIEKLVFEKGNGINTGIIAALDKVGAVEFSDNPLRGDEQSFYFEYLNIPVAMSGGLPEKITSQFTPAGEYDEEVPAMLLGTVKDIKKGKGWSRVELLDSSGTASFFADETTQIKKGEGYLVLVANKRMCRYIPMSEVNPDNKDGLVQWLRIQAPACEDGEAYIISFAGRTTKTGKRMATITYGIRDKTLLECTVWPSDYPSAFSNCKPGTVVKLQTSINDAGDRFYEGVRK